MRKSARIIVSIFFLLFPFILLRPFVKAEDIIEQTTYIPSITFGHLLSGQIPPIQQKQENVLGAERIKELLARLDESSRQSLEEFYQNYPKLKSNTLTSISSPTPSIPIPTYLANNPSTSLGTNSQLTTNTGTIDDNPVKNNFIIALLGDSMVDTLGKDLSHLRQLLGKAYPAYFFALLNYGQGGTDLDSGLFRLTNTTNYLGETYPPLLSFKPDILVVESFAYNHWSGEKSDLDRQWLTIAKIIDTIKEKSPDTKIILASTIAPNSEIFGDGKLNWPKELKSNSAIITKAYLQNMINFATSEHYPLADAYHSSLGGDGNGNERYINQGDHLHPSSEGAFLFSQKIVEAIQNNNLLK